MVYYFDQVLFLIGGSFIISWVVLLLLTVVFFKIIKLITAIDVWKDVIIKGEKLFLIFLLMMVMSMLSTTAMVYINQIFNKARPNVYANSEVIKIHEINEINDYACHNLNGKYDVEFKKCYIEMY